MQLFIYFSIVQMIVLLQLLIAIVLISNSSAVPVPTKSKPPSIDFREGFRHCCPHTEQLLDLPYQWIADCFKQYDNFQKGYDQTSAIYYRKALLGLGMKNAQYNNSVFWSSNDVSDIFEIIEEIGPRSPPSSSNIPSGVFGNCIEEVYEYYPDIITYWFEYSILMARKSASYTFLLTTGDETIHYFPNKTRPSIFETYELSNLKPPRVPGLTVLNARSFVSKGLTCSQDTKSRDKLKSVNSELTYYCCDISMTSSSTLDTINKVIAGMQNKHIAAVLMANILIYSITQSCKCSWLYQDMKTEQ